MNYSVKWRSLLLTVGMTVAAAFNANIASAQPIELKLAYFVGDQHAMSQWLIKWANGLEKDSGGRIVVKRFPGSQMGPMQQHYDLARTGQADVSWFLHGATPGRFPLTEISHLPYLVGSAEIGTKVLNDPELRAKYLDAEHRGVKVLLLLTHQPGNVHTTKTVSYTHLTLPTRYGRCEISVSGKRPGVAPCRNQDTSAWPVRARS